MREARCGKWNLFPVIENPKLQTMHDIMLTAALDSLP